MPSHGVDTGGARLNGDWTRYSSRVHIGDLKKSPMRPRLILLAVLLLAPLAAAGTAAAQPAQPLDRLLPELRRAIPGQFLDAEGITRNGAPGYRLKWLTPDGRVIERDIDARTGRALREGGPPGDGSPRGFLRRDDGAGGERGRPNFAPNFDEAGGDESRPRFNRPFGPRPDGANERFQDRFPGGRFPGRFGRGDDADGAARGPGFGGRRFGGDGARGRGPQQDDGEN